MGHENHNEELSNDIAVVGIACRYPDAKTPEEFWQNLRNGKDSVRDFSDEDLRKAGVPDELFSDPNYVKSGIVLDGMEKFDPSVFGFSPLEASMLDPQHRHFLECSWECLERAGYDPDQFDGAIGLFGGSGHNAYMPYNLFSNPGFMQKHGLFLVRHTGNDKDFLTTRVSYCLNLKGPSVNVQTACSTSLVAIHMASQSLLSMECDMALAGGVTIELPHRQGYKYEDGEILSTDGHCRPFSSDSKGTVFGSGVGVVALKRLEDAIADKDTVYAVVKSSAVNNDGAGKVSYMAPSVDGQAAAIHEALTVADINPETIDYVECHGTGTPIGDPIEVAALTAAFRQETEAKQFCGLGSVKANIGHLDTAAGIAAFTKVVMSLYHREIPASINFKEENPQIDFSNSPFFVNDKLRSWDATDTPRRAGVSSLGVGGTNAHVILEEAPSSLRIETRSESASNHPELFVMSANSEKALDNVSARLKEYFNDRPEVSFADAAYTLKVGRRPLKYRRSFVASTHAELMSKLDAANQQNVHSQRSSDRKQKVAFMFAGGGAQYVNMARDLYNKEPVFKHHIDEALALIKEFVDFDLKSLIFADEQQIESASEELKRPSRSVTAVFVCQYAQAKLWMSWGVNPDALIGHSLGENTAACIAEVFSLKDALGLVALRGKLFEEVEAGGMVSVQLAESQVRENLPSDLDIAAINAQELTVVSGPVDSLAEYETYLKSEGVEYQRVHINIAAHSRMLEPILNSFRNYLKSIKLNEPKLPFISNVTGKWITAEDAMSADYWVSHLRSTVRFGDGVSLLMESNQYLLLEVGPGRILSSLAKAQEQATPDHNIFSSLPHADDDIDDQEFMMSVLGQLWCSNAYTDWAGYYGETTYNRVCLPTYPFEHKKYWVEPGKSAYKGEGTNAGLEKFEKLEDWLYEPVWRRSIAKSAEPAKGSNILVFAETEKFAEMAPFLPETNLVNVSPGTAYRKLSNDSYAINFSDPDAYVHLISDLQSSQLLPDTIIHVLPAAANFAEENYLKHRSFSFDSPFLLSQALANEDIEKKVSWLFVSSGGQRVAGEYLDNPMQSLSLGPVRVIPRELANVHCKLVDLDKDYSWRNALPLLMGELSDEFITDNTVAIRGSSRFNQSFERCRSLGSVNANNIVEGGVYIVTGGIGGLGLVAAKAIAEVSKVTLILISRSVFPSEDQWTTLIEDSAPEARQIEKINEIRQLGSSVKVVAADVSDSASMEKLKDTIQSEGGQIRGLIHTAGVINDSLIQLKELDEALDVLKPKVQGCIVLDQVFNFKSLDFAILYSSTSSFVGLAGQIDYAAANAFQDAFAHSFNDEGHVIALNWPAWKEVGMAASIASGRVGQPAGRLVDHPLLDRCIKEESGLHEFSTVFSVEKYWLLSEHRIKGANCLIPGTGFIELARAAYAEAYGVTNVAIQDAAFILPFVVDDTEQKELRVSIVKSDERCNFTIQSMSGGGWVEHATGIVSDNTATLPEEVSVESLLAGCNRGIQSYEDPEHHPHLEFGSRWACLDAVHYSDTEAVAKISVDRAYVDELKQFVYHPAVMDMATAGAQVLIDGYDPFNEFYVPISYGCLEIFSELPEHVFSYISYKKQSGAHSHDIARFDVSLYDSHGHPIMQVKDFTMQRVSDIDSVAKSASAETIEVDPTLARTLELGISQKDGSQALRYAINQALVPQLAVSVYDLDSLSKELTLPFGAQEETVPQHNPDIDPDIPKIEMLLKNHEAIEEVVIRSFLDEEDERRLIAFYVPDEWEQITTSELRRFAKEVLSEELLPKQFVELDELPLVDGNVDKSQLLDPLAPQDNFLAPRTSTEKAIAKIWQDVLGVSRIGLTDNFFDAGGHSLLSIRAIVRVEKKLGVRLDQAQMVLQTLEQIAKEIHNEKSENQTENNASGQGKDVVSEAQDADSGAKKKSSILKGLFSRGKN